MGHSGIAAECPQTNSEINGNQMKIVEKLSDRGASPADIHSVELLVGRPLPEDYTRFLYESNGGRPEPFEFSFRQYGKEQGSVLDWFFTLDQAEPIYFLPSKIDTFKDRIPVHLLPIATDPFGNLILLDVGAKSVGSIYFWDHENENSNGDAWWNNISFIAPSFTDFVNGLH